MCDLKPFGELSDAEKGALLLAHHEGKKIHRWSQWGCRGQWADNGGNKLFDAIPYRIAPEPLIPDSIDFSHITDDVVAIARSEGDLNAILYTSVPRVSGSRWFGDAAGSASRFASYRRGTVDWKDSLVVRPS